MCYNDFVKKIVKISSIVVIFNILLGCKNPVIDNSKANLQKYEAYYQSIMDNDVFLHSSENFSIEAVMNTVDDHFRFSIILDEPKIAMFSIEMMAIIDDGSVSINYETVMPASGIFDRSYDLIPYQQNEAAGFPRGIILDGLCDKPTVNLLVLVSWKNIDGTEVYKEYFQLEAKLDKTAKK